ncbi:uncharacterized protein LOC133628955 isoform X3 [Colius striatus]|uniref:uncharacterized protein LOC133628955 isoform X3 n=1 Tax=Colius striatus TaxID=57412 RepID=UPI002B1DEF82|nr:uncharacterized protein LOC133628955 isoform X3 [Colius striatus]
MVRQLCPCSPGRPQGAQTHWQPVEEPTPQRSATWWKWSSPLNLPDPDQDLPEAERPSKVSAKHVLGKSFWELNLQDPHDMVVTLLHHAPSCNRDAATIWREIIPNGETAEKVLRELLLVLQDWPLHSTCTSDGGRKDAFALAATRALLEIICKPEYFINVSDHFPQLFLALIFQIFSSTEELPEDLDTLWQGHQQEDCLPTAPSRQDTSTVPLVVAERGFSLRAGPADCKSLAENTSRVQLLSLQLFQRVMEGVNPMGRKLLKAQVHQSLILLLCLLHEESQEVAEASRVTLLGAATFLKKRRL